MKRLILLLLILSICQSLFSYSATAAESPDPVIIDSKNVVGYQPYSATLLRDITVTAPSSSNYEVKSWKLIKNGVDKGQLGTYDPATRKITINGVNGNPVTVTGDRQSHMVHDIWRGNTGKTWQTGVDGIGIYTFDADPTSIENGVSQWPGLFPQMDRDGQLIRPELRYQDGSAAAWTDSLEPPEKFKKSDGMVVATSLINPASITIIGAEPNPLISPDLVIDAWGRKQSATDCNGGCGMLHVHLPMDKDHNILGVDYKDITPASQHAPSQGREYVLESTTHWSGTTYELNYQIQINYGPKDTDPDSVDLIADDIVVSDMIDIGKTITFTGKYHNEGAKIDTPYRVKVLDETGAQIFLSPFIASAPANSDTLTVTFSYKFTSTKTKEFTLIVDSSGAVNEASEFNNEKTVPFTPGDPGGGGSHDFTGDFDVLPDTINYHDSFSLHPKNIDLQGCTYNSHSFRIERDGRIWNGPAVTNQHSDMSFTSSTYPNIIGTGTHDVYMILHTSCGDKTIGPKPLTVNSGDNHPPMFELAWVYPSAPTVPVYQAPEGAVLDLVVIQDPSVPTPYDQDGDTLYFDGFFFSQSSSSWIKSLESRYAGYAWAIPGVTMDTAGYHPISAQIRDALGATATASTYITIVAPNPVAVPRCPTKVISNHPVNMAEFDASLSYSPAGRTINHSRDEWSNKLDHYVNNTDQDITVYVQLNVYDSTGLKSLTAGSCTITVEPDRPPIAQLDVPSLGIRNEPAVIVNTSYSPDGDEIVEASYKYKYDANNNGFSDDAWKAINGNLENVTLYPDKVGKYLFYVKVTEDYGQSADTSGVSEALYTLDVVNNAPEVSFEVEGKNPQPDLNPSTTIRPETMINWPVYVTNDTQQVYNKNNLWRAEGGSLLGGEGRNFGGQQPYFYIQDTLYSSYEDVFPQTNNGFGSNRLSPWRAGTNFKPDLTGFVIDKNERKLEFDIRSRIRSNRKLIYFDQREYGSNNTKNQITIYALDPKKLSKQEWYSPDGWSIKYHYLKGSPYTFTIVLPFTNNNDTSTWELAGRYLYTMVTDDSGKITITVYDALTGAVIRSKSFDHQMGRGTSITGWWEISHAQGDSILLRRNNNFPDPKEDVTQWMKLSPELTAQNLPSWKAPAARNPGMINSNTDYHISDTLYEDPTGAIYTYEGYADDYEEFIDMNIAKYNADMTLAWRTYLTSSTEPGWLGNNKYGVPSVKLFEPITMNPMKNELEVINYSNFTTYHSILNTSTGTVKSRTTGANSTYMDWSGNKIAGETSSVTTDGYRTYWPIGTSPGPCNDQHIDVFNPNGSLASQNEPLCDSQSHQLFGEYFGDGVFVYVGGDPDQSYRLGLGISVGTPTTSPLVHKAFTNGQFYSNISLNDVDMRFSFRMEDVNYDKDLAGFSFRMQDPRNRYAIETDGHSFNLVKYVNGKATVLKSGSYAFQSNVSYAVRVKTEGSQIDVFLNNIPILSASDSTYKEGRFGYFSDKAFVAFSAFTYKAVKSTIEWSDSYAIWDEGTAKAEVAYDNIQFLDPEGDPMAGSYQWTVQHTPRFINNQGVSTLNGKTFNSEQLTFDKVGDYVVTLRAKDDPNPSYRYPNNTFDGYRKNSNAIAKRVTVHRRPVSQFTVKAGSDGKVLWTDSSYDPDRYASATNYSTENTGIDYKATRGILEKKFYYITPSGTTVMEKLVTPAEKGIYEIGMAVKDEYGAWSDYTVTTLNIAKIPTPNTPPVPGFTTSVASTYRGVAVTINSTAHDAEDGGRENLPHQYYIRNQTIGDGETLQSASRTSWNKIFNSLGVFNIRQMVQDSLGVEAQFNRQVTINNRLPVTQVTVPQSADQNNPTKLTELRPAFQWTYSDADHDPQSRFQLRIYKYGGILYLDTDVRPGSGLSWRPSVDLPEHVNLYVQVRVYDGYDWSNWSNPKYFYIETNQPPTADFDWMPKPVYEGDTVRLSYRLDDPDRDILTAETVVTAPDGTAATFRGSFGPPYATAGPEFRATRPGSYAVRLSVSDGKAPPVVVGKTITVLPLSVIGTVSHTELWDERRLTFNEQHKDDAASQRGDSVFWAGEKFMLAARTTDTQTATTAQSVTVQMNGFSVQLTAEDASHTRWTGMLWDESFERLPDGPLTFTFTAVYSNGTVKTDTVVVTLRGDVEQTVGVHRRQ